MQNNLAQKQEITSKIVSGEDITCATVVREDDTWSCYFETPAYLKVKEV
jgi:hypothetical protein